MMMGKRRKAGRQAGVTRKLHTTNRHHHHPFTLGGRKGGVCVCSQMFHEPAPGERERRRRLQKCPQGNPDPQGGERERERESQIWRFETFSVSPCLPCPARCQVLPER